MPRCFYSLNYSGLVAMQIDKYSLTQDGKATCITMEFVGRMAVEFLYIRMCSVNYKFLKTF